MGSKKEQDITAWQVVTGTRYRFSGLHIITINAKFGRIIMSSPCYNHCKEMNGKDFGAVLLLTNPKEPGKFLIKPCERADDGSRLIHMAAGSRVISAKTLLTELEFGSTTALHFNAQWIDSLKALLVDTAKPLDKPQAKKR
jgi:hypothetical protein